MDTRERPLQNRIFIVLSTISFFFLSFVFYLSWKFHTFHNFLYIINEDWRNSNRDFSLPLRPSLTPLPRQPRLLYEPIEIVYRMPEDSSWITITIVREKGREMQIPVVRCSFDAFIRRPNFLSCSKISSSRVCCNSRRRSPLQAR